jgi:transcriptional regulator with XRE-family HTH domain
MSKSIYTKRYRRFLALLREARIASNTTQNQLAEMIGVSQSVISKMESGERRLDVVEVYDICHALGVNTQQFFTNLVKEIEKQ